MTRALPELSAALIDAEAVLASARPAEPAGYAGGLSPVDAWTLFATGHAVLVDVRTVEELAYVGRVPGSLHVPWATGTAQTRNPRWAAASEQAAPAKLAPMTTKSKSKSVRAFCMKRRAVKMGARCLALAGWRWRYGEAKVK